MTMIVVITMRLRVSNLIKNEKGKKGVPKIIRKNR